MREQETHYCPRIQKGHQSEPDAGFQSSERPRCTAGRAGQRLEEREEVRQRHTAEEKREKQKKVEKYRKQKKEDR